MKTKILTAWLLTSMTVFANPFQWDARIDQPHLQVGATTEVYLLIDFKTEEAQLVDPKNRTNLNLNMVIDRSGSMRQQGKLEYAKEAASEVVKALSNKDHLGIVEYDNLVNVLWPSQKIENKKNIVNKINGLQPRNATNLAGGMIKGISEVERALEFEYLNRVFLLSDGLANNGITDPVAIARIAKEAKAKGITVSTLGLGVDYNEDLLQKIAEEGGGNYYFVESPTQLPEIFNNEMNSLFQTVTKNMSIEFHRSVQVKDPSVIGYSFQTQKELTTISIENLYAPDEKTVLMKLNIKPSDLGEFDVGDVIVKGIDASTNKTFEYRKSISAIGTNDKEIIKAKLKKEVRSEAVLIESEEEQLAAIKDYEAGRIDDAREKTKKLKKKMKENSVLLGDARLSKKAEALEMEEQDMVFAFSAGGSASKGYLKKVKANSYKAKRGKRGSYMVQLGDFSKQVVKLKSVLVQKGFLNSSDVGIGKKEMQFDDKLEKAVKDFQKKNGMVVDGIAGPKVLKALGMY